MSKLLEGLDFHVFFDAAADALVLADDAGKVALANPAASELFGYKREEMPGMAVEALIPERFRENHRRYRDMFLHHPEKRAMGNGKELLGLARDGRELMVDIGLSPLRWDGRSYVLITFFDATRRRQATQALQESEERLRLAKRAAGLGIFDHDLVSGTTRFDERARDIWGIERDEDVTFEQALAYVHPADRETRQAALKNAADPASGEYFAEFRVVDPSATIERWVMATGQTFFEQGRAVRIVGTVRDITVQKAVEQRLQEQRAEMETLLKQQVAVQTASAIAHELNQPLAALSAYSEVALHEMGRVECPEKLKRALNGCVDQAHRAGKTLHELLEFLQKGKLVTAPMDINETVREAISIALNDGFGGFRTQLELQGSMPPVLANRLQIQKVLTNLVRNGVEAMREANVIPSGIVIRVQTMEEENMALVTVQDSGPGLDAEAARRIFEPFYTTKPHGIGMGLAISRALIRANGGQLWVDTDAGPGATFHFTLPFAS